MKQNGSGAEAGGKRSGFTRIELAGVLGVAGVLAAGVLPVAAQGGLFDVFGRARENARRASCQSNLKQISLGLLQYSTDYDEMMPLAASTGKGLDTRSSTAYGWADALYPYLKSKLLFVCPSERHTNAEQFSSKGFSDYWLNRNVARKGLAVFPAPAQTLTMGDGDGGSAASTARYSITALAPLWKETPRSPARRHLEGANYAFLDGHVKWIVPARISTASLAKAGDSPTFATK